MKKVNNFDDYLNNLDSQTVFRFKQIFDLCDKLMPLAFKIYSNSMPTYRDKINIVYFSNTKKHIAVYIHGEIITLFSEELSNNGILYTNGTIKLEHNKDINYELLAKIFTEAYNKEIKDNS